MEGTTLALVADAARVDNLVDAVYGADALVIESTYCQVEADLAKAYGHLTATQAAQLAREAQVRQLILTHLSRRYPEHEVAAEARAVGSAGCNNFHGSYTADGGKIQLGPLATTRRACADELMNQEKQFLAAPASAVTWKIDGNVLDMHRADGERAIWAVWK